MGRRSSVVVMIRLFVVMVGIMIVVTIMGRGFAFSLFCLIADTFSMSFFLGLTPAFFVRPLLLLLAAFLILVGAIPVPIHFLLGPALLRFNLFLPCFLRLVLGLRLLVLLLGLGNLRLKLLPFADMFIYFTLSRWLPIPEVLMCLKLVLFPVEFFLIMRLDTLCLFYTFSRHNFSSPVHISVVRWRPTAIVMVWFIMIAIRVVVIFPIMGRVFALRFFGNDIMTKRLGVTAGFLVTPQTLIFSLCRSLVLVELPPTFL